MADESLPSAQVFFRQKLLLNAASKESEIHKKPILDLRLLPQFNCHGSQLGHIWTQYNKGKRGSSIGRLLTSDFPSEAYGGQWKSSQEAGGRQL